MYSLLIYLYIAGVKLAALFGHRKARLLVEGHKNIFPLLKERLRPGEKYLWFHVSSLGEFEQGRPVMERLRESHPASCLPFFLHRDMNRRRNISRRTLFAICRSILVATWAVSLIF